jgi:hypothetical protein
MECNLKIFAEKKRNQLLLILFLTIVPFMKVICQDIENSLEPPKEQKQKIGYTVWEFTPIGVGINHTFRPKRWKPSKYSLSYCISGYQANLILATNDKYYNELHDSLSVFLGRFSVDFIRFKYSLKRKLARDFDLEVSLFASISVSPAIGEDNYYPLYGIESSAYYLNLGRVGFATSVIFSRSMVNQSMYFQIIPLKLTLRIRSKDYKHLM